MSTEMSLIEVPIETLAEMAAEKAALVEQHGRKTVQAAIDCGRYLTEIKSRLGHGEWLPWLEENWPQSQSRAYQYMKLANFHNCTNLDLAECANVHSALKLIGEAEEAAGTKRTRKAPEPAPEVIDNRPAPPQATLLPGEEVDFSDRRKPGQERVRPLPATELPPEEPPALPKTNTLHSPATQQRIDRGPDPAPAQAVQDTHESPMLEVVIAQHGTTVEDAYGMPLLEVVIAQHTTREVIDALIVGLEGTQAKRVAEILREAADKLDPQPVVVHHEPASKPARPGKHPSADQLMDVARTYVTAWSGQLMTQVCAWAEYKQSLTGNAKVRSLASWETMLTRIDNVQKMRGAGTVCEMISKAIANGWQGWEHETNGSRSGSRISTAVRSNRNWDEEIPEWKPTE